MKIITTLILWSFISVLHAVSVPGKNTGPWFTGPLLASHGRTVARGHGNFENYVFYSTRTGIYGPNHSKIDNPLYLITQINPLITAGLTDSIDLQLSVPYTINKTQGVRGEHLSDTSVVVGFQTLRQRPGSWIPDFRISLQEVFPTGRFTTLNPTDKGTGESGAGAYDTVIGFNFQEVFQISEHHYLRPRLALAYLHSYPFSLVGKKIFDIQAPVKGEFIPRDTIAGDLAAEFTLDQNWVAVMEIYSFYHQRSSFDGIIGGPLPPGEHVKINSRDIYVVSLAPAIEYNFTEHYGVIGGMWFSINGRNAPIFSVLTVALNISW